MQHTPGPWIANFRVRNQSTGVGDWVFFAEGGAPILRNGRRSVADARLIAAAPDMLVALQNLTTNITQHQQLMDVVELSTFEAALAAIAKATREAPWSETERLT
jgi:prophage DNA circulation protein